MQLEFLIPISLFVCITLAIKYVMDGRTRRRLAETHASEELIKAMLQADEVARRLAALKWGLVLVSVGLGFGLVDILRLNEERPGAFGLIAAFAGAGMLVYHFIASRSK